jgi:uncharacterized membrane protein YidH (DUF202 family)
LTLLEQTPAEDMEDMDPGLAGERTELAWTRTAISFAALGGAILKITPAVGVLVLAASALVWEIGRLARRSGRRRAGDRRRVLLLITVAVTVVSAAALAVALLGSGESPLTPR